MTEEQRIEKEKKNKKTSLTIMIILCVIFSIAGIGGGVIKFVNFVNKLTSPDVEQLQDDKCQFYKDGTLTFCVNDSEVSKYKCESSSCGWAYGFNEEPAGTQLRTPPTQAYVYNYLINNSYAIIYDGESSQEDAYHRSAGVKIIPIRKMSDAKSYSAIKNYNNRENTIFIVQENNNWGVISLENSGIEEKVKSEYSYIGVFVPEKETYNEQQYYAAKLGNEWLIISINNRDNTKASVNYADPIAGYDLRTVVTKNDNGYDVYNLNGDLIIGNQKDFRFIGLSTLVVTTDDKVTVYNTFNNEELDSISLAQVGELSIDYKDNNKIDIVVSNQVISVQGEKHDKKNIGISDN